MKNTISQVKNKNTNKFFDGINKTENNKSTNVNILCKNNINEMRINSGILFRKDFNFKQ